MKERFPRHEALAIADELVAALLPYVDRIVIAGFAATPQTRRRRYRAPLYSQHRGE